ncbi:hypothetical protein PHMEG_0004694 [Phytophthora megakarya]|uniref:Integrase catalytic domain-containing protein n=1 Tax=Phytophthora megakarya TaxID=4795 RepID=A0A225WT79_9STRA|nr:hypothetical protein PHMEG_0004694 [Phytophthora megakarya]
MRKVYLKVRAGPARTTLVPEIPLHFIETVLHYCHADLFSAHSGTTKTIDKVRKHLTGNDRSVTDTKSRQQVYFCLCRLFHTVGRCVAVKKLDTVTSVNLIVDEVVSRHGVPERLLSDRGSNFISNLAQSFYQPLGIKTLFGTAYHSQTQFLVEMPIGTLLGLLRDSPFFSLYGRNPILPLDLAFLNTSRDRKSNEVTAYRRKLFLPMRDSRRMVELQLLKVQSRHARRLVDQVPVFFAEGDAVWVYQYFRARRGERKTKKLAFSWHGPYRVVGPVGENAYGVANPSYLDRISYGKSQPYQKLSRTEEPTFSPRRS